LRHCAPPNENREFVGYDGLNPIAWSDSADIDGAAKVGEDRPKAFLIERLMARVVVALP
jgi:hypothetical protein